MGGGGGRAQRAGAKRGRSVGCDLPHSGPSRGILVPQLGCEGKGGRGEGGEAGQQHAGAKGRASHVGSAYGEPSTGSTSATTHAAP